MLDVAGLSLTDIEREVLRHPQVGGVILFARNYESPEQLLDLTISIRDCREHLLIAVDHEGGRVQRFRTGFTRIPSMYSLAQNTPDLLMPAARIMALELMASGVDFTFAPVLDRYNPESDVIGDRAFDHNIDRLIGFAGTFIEGLNQEGMPAVGKHFPGHGGVTGDTHTESAIDPRCWADIAQTDLMPFAQLSSKLAGIMPAHVTFPEVCDSPVGFSTYWLQSVLREQLGFRGITFSDDLAMAAAKIAGSPLERGLAALDAGCDMILLCNEADDAFSLIEGLEAHGEVDHDQASKKAAQFLQLSARKKRQQQGFSWQALQQTTFWQTHHAQLTDLSC